MDVSVDTSEQLRDSRCSSMNLGSGNGVDCSGRIGSISCLDRFGMNCG